MVMGDFREQLPSQQSMRIVRIPIKKASIEQPEKRWRQAYALEPV